MYLIKETATVNDFRFQEGGMGGEKHPYCRMGKKVASHIWEKVYLPEGFEIGIYQFKTLSEKGFELLPYNQRKSYDNTDQFGQEVLDVLQKLADVTNQAIQLHNEELFQKFVTPNPEWVKAADLELLATRLESEFGTTIYRCSDCFIAEYQEQVWNIATGEGNFVLRQGHYDGNYFPKMGQNLAQRLSFLSLRQSLHLSRETVKSFLHRPSKELSNKEFAEWFSKWLGQSSWKSKYWFHHDIDNNQARVSVIANHSKDMLICTTSDGIHVISGKNHFVVKRLPQLFYKFATSALENGKDHSVSGTGWALTW